MPSYRITTPDGQKFKITADNDQAAQAAISDLLGSNGKQVMSGFGERSQREQDMPLDQDTQRELDIAKRMAVQRQTRGGFGEATFKGALQNFNDEVSGLAAGLVQGPIKAGEEAKDKGILSGLASIPGHIAEQYDIGKEATSRLQREYDDQHPILSAVGQVGGSLAAPRLFTKDPVGLGAQIGQNVVEGGVYGALGGLGEGDSIEERLGNAAKGVGIGVGVGVAAPALLAGGGYAARKFGGPLIDGVRVLMGKGEDVARGKVAGALANDVADGSTRLTEREFARAQRNGQDVRLLDRGGNSTLALADSADVLSPQARGGMRAVSQDRFQSQSGRMEEAYGRVGGHADDLEIEDGLTTAAKAANKAAYDRAYKAGNRDLWDEKLSSLSESDAVQDAIKAAIAKQRNKRAAEGTNVRSFIPRVTVDEQSGRIIFQKGDVHSYPDLELWDLAKRELGQKEKAALRTGHDEDAKMYGDLTRELRNHLDTLVPEYAKARGVAATAFGTEDALEAGRLLAKSKDPSASRKVARVWNKMTDAEKKLFRQGYTAIRSDQMRSVGKNVNAANKVQNSPEQQMLDKIVLGRRAAILAETKKVEDVMQGTKGNFGGSKTAERLLGHGVSAGLGSAAGGYSSDGDWKSITLGGLAGIGAKKGKMRLDQSVANHVARILTSSDPKAMDRLLLLAQKNPQVAQALEGATRSITRANALLAPRIGMSVGDSE